MHRLPATMLLVLNSYVKPGFKFAMQPYTIQIAGGRQARVLRKESGRKRSPRLFFIRIRRSKTLIAYFVDLEDVDTSAFTMYKIRKTGLWLKRTEKENGKIYNSDWLLIEEIKRAIDLYESALGDGAYKILF